MGAWFFLRELTAKGAEIVIGASVRALGVVATVVNSCSASSLAVVEFDTLSIDRRDMISSRVEAFIGRIEKKEESALARRLGARFAPLECVETVAGELERE